MLEVSELFVHYRKDKDVVHAVEGVSFSLEKGESLAIVGESGSGKSTLALSILGLLPKNAEVRGRILFFGEDLLSLDEKVFMKIRGRKIGMIFQHPKQSFNPLYTIGAQIEDTLRVHFSLKKEEAKEFACSLLHRVQIKECERILQSYPHQLSGGLAQRCMIAMALSLKPSLLLADEPTSGLDTQTAEGIIQLFSSLIEEEGMGTIIITHQIALAERLCKKVAVFYGGRILEYGGKDVFSSPLHPYTEALLLSLPQRGKKLQLLDGEPPDMTALPKGCKFHPRCKKRKKECQMQEPPLREVKDGYFLRCFLH